MLDIKKLKKILLVRLDNMGDVIMSTPAFQVIKNQSNAKLTLLTSHKGAPIAKLLTMIDEVLAYDLPWLKQSKQDKERSGAINELINMIENAKYDACIIFSVYSQSILPTALLAWMAKIPIIAGYCRENPYELISHWIVDTEPFTTIKHQIKRDLDLVERLGFSIENAGLPTLNINQDIKIKSFIKFILKENYVILHPGVSEIKREYPLKNWIDIVEQLLECTDYKIVITGSETENQKYAILKEKDPNNRIFNLMGLLTIEEMCIVIKNSNGMISVNTGPAHIAMAFNQNLIVLYAETNPQHTTWSENSRTLVYSIPKNLESRNFIIQAVNKSIYKNHQEIPPAPKVVKMLLETINNNKISKKKERQN